MAGSGELAFALQAVSDILHHLTLPQFLEAHLQLSVLLAGFKGSTSKGGEGLGERMGGKEIKSNQIKFIRHKNKV